MAASPSSPPPRRGRPRDERARAAILGAVASLLADHGFEGVTMEGIAAEAGVGKQTIYRWWPSKAAVIGEAFLDDYVTFPQVPLPHTDDVWSDLESWLRAGGDGFGGHYGDIIRVAAAVASEDATIGARMNEKFSEPPRRELLGRLHEAVDAGQITDSTNLDAIVDLLQAVVAHAGWTRAGDHVIPNALTIIRAAAERVT